MGAVVANMSMSLDGFIADPDDRVDELFEWYTAGDVEVTTANPGVSFRLDQADAAELEELFASVGALITGRRLFDITGGWGGKHPVDCPVFVVTHSVPDGWPRDDAPFTFVRDGVESAVTQAQAVAGDKIVAVASADVAQQCLEAGLLDEIRVDLVPVLLGTGIPFFTGLTKRPVSLDDPIVSESRRVTHLRYRIRKG